MEQTNRSEWTQYTHAGEKWEAWFNTKLFTSYQCTAASSSSGETPLFICICITCTDNLHDRTTCQLQNIITEGFPCAITSCRSSACSFLVDNANSGSWKGDTIQIHKEVCVNLNILTSSSPSLLTTCIYIYTQEKAFNIQLYQMKSQLWKCRVIIVWTHVLTLKLYPWLTKNLCRFVEKCISSVSCEYNQKTIQPYTNATTSTFTLGTFDIEILNYLRFLWLQEWTNLWDQGVEEGIVLLSHWIYKGRETAFKQPTQTHGGTHTSLGSQDSPKPLGFLAIGNRHCSISTIIQYITYVLVFWNLHGLKFESGHLHRASQMSCLQPIKVCVNKDWILNTSRRGFVQLANLGDKYGIDERIVFEVLEDFHPLLLVSLTINERPVNDKQTKLRMWSWLGIHTVCKCITMMHIHLV